MYLSRGTRPAVFNARDPHAAEWVLRVEWPTDAAFHCCSRRRPGWLHATDHNVNGSLSERELAGPLQELRRLDRGDGGLTGFAEVDRQPPSE